METSASSPRPSISVVVPFRSNGREIERCCSALLGQEYPADAYELLFVDNDSRDGSRTIVEAHPRIRLLRQPSTGAYAARNLGVEQARGGILAFTDADCAVAPDWLVRIAEAMSDRATDIVLGSYTAPTSRFPASGLNAYENAKNRLIFSGRDASLYYGYANNMAVRRSVFERLGPFPERLRGSDVILVRRQVSAAGPRSVRYLDEMQVDHLELLGVRDYLRKVKIHSASVHALQSVSSVRPLSHRERITAFRAAVRAEGYPARQALLLFAILCAGLVWWDLGKLSPSPERPRSPDRRDERLGEAA